MQSVPTVYAFSGGRPVDGFMGAVPESQLKAFMDKLIGQAPLSEIDELLLFAKEALDAQDVSGAAQARFNAVDLARAVQIVEPSQAMAARIRAYSTRV